MLAVSRKSGFTIVELLIVIVVIAILAAITIVAYNGIRDRADNTAIIDAAAKSKRVIEAYIVSAQQYPWTVESEYVCITVDTSCRRNGGPQGVLPAFQTTIASVGSLPKSAPLVSDIRGGVTYNYVSSRTVDGQSAPAILSYYLKGINTDCGMAVVNSEGTSPSTTSTKYTVGNVGSSGSTQCVVSLSGPKV